MNIQDSHFRYNTILKAGNELKFEALSLFPSLCEISFQSRVFLNYAECVKSCKGMLEDVSKEINLGAESPKFKVGAEINPIHTGNSTLSKDWVDAEVARFWIYDRGMEGAGDISAVCRGSIFAISKEDSQIIYN